MNNFLFFNYMSIEFTCAMCMKELNENEKNPCMICVKQRPDVLYPLWCDMCYTQHIKHHQAKHLRDFDACDEGELFDAICIQERLRQTFGSQIGIM